MSIMKPSIMKPSIMKPTAEQPVVAMVQTEAKHIVDEKLTAETEDHCDHTFNGVMFPVQCLEKHPVAYVVVDSISVRGHLGPLTVWTARGDCNCPKAHLHNRPDQWEKIYEQTLPPSEGVLTKLPFTKKIKIRRGEKVSFYVHSKLDDDRAIVYDNRRRTRKRGDSAGRIRIFPGRAHLWHVPFIDQNPWGHYSRSGGWRLDREFVGTISYGVRYMKWTPKNNEFFPAKFQQAATVMLQLCLDKTSRLRCLPKEVIYYIMNVCEWNYWGETEENEEEDDEEAEEFERRRQIAGQQRYYSMTQAQMLHLLMLDLANQHEHEDDDDDDNDDDDEEYLPDNDEDDDVEELEDDEQEDDE